MSAKTTANFFTTRSRHPAMIYPVSWYYPVLTTERCKEDFGMTFRKVGTRVENNMRRDYYYPLEDAHAFQDALVTKIETDSTYVQQLHKKLERDSRTLQRFTDEHESKNIEKFTAEQLWATYKEYADIYTELNYPILVIVVVGLQNVIEKVQSFIADTKDFEVVLKPDRRPYLLDYELDLLTSKPAAAAELHRKWYWIPFDYYGADQWDREYFEQEARAADAKRQRELEDYEQLTTEEKNVVLKKYDVTAKQRAVAEALGTLNWLQDYRKLVTNRSYPFWQNLVQAIAKHTGVTVEQLWVMSPAEVQAALEGQTKDVSHRLAASASEVYENSVVMHEEVPDFLELPDEESDQRVIKGTSASPGKVVGAVRLCVKSPDVKRMKEGEILVASATTPDYILGFKRAAAVITDEGGLTSHAAVVSREMNLPCVVGTGNASQILNDGDKVEVDADNGIVRRL